ncbi:MAG: 50S ribosomal protein L29 [Candidatus Absconditabacteria bacterium]
MKGKALFMKELSGKSVKELVIMRKTLKQDLFGLKTKNAIRGLKETHKIGDARVKISRINTVLTHKIKENYGNHMN